MEPKGLVHFLTKSEKVNKLKPPPPPHPAQPPTWPTPVCTALTPSHTGPAPAAGGHIESARSAVVWNWSVTLVIIGRFWLQILLLFYLILNMKVCLCSQKKYKVVTLGVRFYKRSPTPDFTHSRTQIPRKLFVTFMPDFICLILSMERIKKTAALFFLWFLSGTFKVPMTSLSSPPSSGVQTPLMSYKGLCP